MEWKRRQAEMLEQWRREMDEQDTAEEGEEQEEEEEEEEKTKQEKLVLTPSRQVRTKGEEDLLDAPSPLPDDEEDDVNSFNRLVGEESDQDSSPSLSHTPIAPVDASAASEEPRVSQLSTRAQLSLMRQRMRMERSLRREAVREEKRGRREERRRRREEREEAYRVAALEGEEALEEERERQRLERERRKEERENRRRESVVEPSVQAEANAASSESNNVDATAIEQRSTLLENEQPPSQQQEDHQDQNQDEVEDEDEDWFLTPRPAFRRMNSDIEFGDPDYITLVGRLNRFGERREKEMEARRKAAEVEQSAGIMKAASPRETPLHSSMSPAFSPLAPTLPTIPSDDELSSSPTLSSVSTSSLTTDSSPSSSSDKYDSEMEIQASRLSIAIAKEEEERQHILNDPTLTTQQRQRRMQEWKEKVERRKVVFVMTIASIQAARRERKRKEGEKEMEEKEREEKEERRKTRMRQREERLKNKKERAEKRREEQRMEQEKREKKKQEKEQLNEAQQQADGKKNHTQSIHPTPLNPSSSSSSSFSSSSSTPLRPIVTPAPISSPHSDFLSQFRVALSLVGSNSNEHAEWLKKMDKRMQEIQKQVKEEKERKGDKTRREFLNLLMEAGQEEKDDEVEEEKEEAKKENQGAGTEELPTLAARSNQFSMSESRLKAILQAITRIKSVSSAAQNATYAPLKRASVSTRSKATEDGEEGERDGDGDGDEVEDGDVVVDSDVELLRDLDAVDLERVERLIREYQEAEEKFREAAQNESIVPVGSGVIEADGSTATSSSSSSSFNSSSSSSGSSDTGAASVSASSISRPNHSILSPSSSSILSSSSSSSSSSSFSTLQSHLLSPIESELLKVSLSFQSSLFYRLTHLFSQLHMPSSQRLHLLEKYSKAEWAPKLLLALQMWEEVGRFIVQREELLNLLSQPLRSTEKGEEEKEEEKERSLRFRLYQHSRLEELTQLLYSKCVAQRSLFEDEATWKGESYVEKMRKEDANKLLEKVKRIVKVEEEQEKETIQIHSSFTIDDYRYKPSSYVSSLPLPPPIRVHLSQLPLLPGRFLPITSPLLLPQIAPIRLSEREKKKMEELMEMAWEFQKWTEQVVKREERRVQIHTFTSSSTSSSSSSSNDEEGRVRLTHMLMQANRMEEEKETKQQYPMSHLNWKKN